MFYTRYMKSTIYCYKTYFPYKVCTCSHIDPFWNLNRTIYYKDLRVKHLFCCITLPNLHTWRTSDFLQEPVRIWLWIGSMSKASPQMCGPLINLFWNKMDQLFVCFAHRKTRKQSSCDVCNNPCHKVCNEKEADQCLYRYIHMYIQIFHPHVHTQIYTLCTE